MKIKTKFISLSCSFLLLVCSSIVIEIKSVSQRNLESQLIYLPSGRFLQGAALSYDGLVADLLWIKAVSYFSDQYTAGKGNYQWLYHILDITTTLDPYFHSPYEFGGIILSGEVGDVAHSSALLKKGIENVPKTNPRYWYLPFFLGYNYWYYDYNYKEGAKFLEIASKFPQAPSYLPMLTARMYADADSAELALPFLDEMIDNAQNDQRRERLVLRKKEVLVNYHLDILDNSIEVYYNKNSYYPSDLTDLIDQKILPQIPVEPFGGEYEYDIEKKRAYSTMSKRIKVHERKEF